MTTYTCPTCKLEYHSADPKSTGPCPYCGPMAKAMRAAQLIMNGQNTISTAYGIKSAKGIAELITDIMEDDHGH